MSSGHRRNSKVAGSPGRRRPLPAVLLAVLMFVSVFPLISPPAASDPWYADDGDMTRDVIWDLTNAGDYATENASVSGGSGTLALLNDTVVDNETADFALGTGTNTNLLAAQNAIVIDNTSSPVQTIVIQPGPEGKDNYLDEWFSSWSPPEGSNLDICGDYDPDPVASKRSYIIMQFNLSSIPAGATIRSSTLQLFESGGRAGLLAYTIHAVNSSWEEVGVSWTSRMSGRYWDFAGGDFSTEVFASGTIDDANGWHSFEFTRLVDLWTRNVIPNYGFVVATPPITGDNTKTFTDCEITNKPEQRPKLEISYTVGAASCGFDSRPMGDELNCTFTLAQWTNGTFSKATDEFESPGLSGKWGLLSDPRLAGGAIDWEAPGWLNITGSLSTNLTSPNYLFQMITGDFRFVTSLQGQFTADTIGAGILLRNDSKSWLALYKIGGVGAGFVVAEICNGSRHVLNQISWPDTDVFLRMDRAGTTYSMMASDDGLAWDLVATITPKCDFTKRVSLGLCAFSGDLPLRPVVRFDFARVEPLNPADSLSLMVRTGNSTVLADPSWTAWSAPLLGPEGVIGLAARYIQYRITMNTSCDWYSPMFSGFECHLERYSENGTIVTGDVSPPCLASWQTLIATQSAANGLVTYSYSIDHGTTWITLGTGTSFDISESQPSIMVKMALATYDTLSTPFIDSIDLVYLISHAGFYVSAPQSVMAGVPFQIFIEPKDTDNNTANWTGPVDIHARDVSGVFPTSSELHVTNSSVPIGGHLTIADQIYDTAETIRILVSGGGATGISSPITVSPGPVSLIVLEPNVTRIPEDNSTVFNATGYDAFGNELEDPTITWHADATLGSLNSSSGRSVMLTTASFVSGGYLNVTINGMTLSRYIEVAPIQSPPEIDPVLPTQTKIEDFGSWTLDLSPFVSDREDDLSELKWYAVNHSIVSITGENRTGEMTITFTTIQNVFGVEDVEVRIVDSSRMTASAKMTVNITAVNDPPRIDPIDPLFIRFEDPYAYDIRYYVHDVEEDAEELVVTVDSASASYVDVEGFWLTFTYPESMDGTQQTVLVTVSDGELSAATYILVTITGDYPPRTRGSLPNLQMYQGDIVLSYFDLDTYFTDPDGDMMIYAYGNSHVSVLINPNNTVDFYAPYSWYGEEYIVFRANDSLGARAESAMVVTVIAVNQAPRISGVPDILVRYGEEYSLDLGPYVDDGDDPENELTVTTSDFHVWAEGLELTILYPVGMTGLKIPVTITVSDGELSDSWVMNVTVSADHPPIIIISPPDFSFQEDQPMPYPESGHISDFFSDPDGEPLVFMAFVSSPNVTATAETTGGNWTVLFQTDENWNGVTDLTLRAIDGHGALVETTVILTVISVADRPTLSLPGSFSIVQGVHSILDITKDITDPDSVLSELRFVVAEEYSAYVDVHSGLVMFDFPDDYLGKDEKSRDISISITVFDQDNLFSTDTIKVTVTRGAGTTSSANPLLWLALIAAAAAASVFAAFAVIRRRKPFVVRDMMLIHNDGFLISRQAKPVAGEIDEHVLSGMLTAVLNFVEDSMSKNHGSLTTFGFQEYQVMVQRGEHVFAAVVFEGDEPDAVEESLREFIKKFDRIYHKKLLDWTGDIETDFAGADVLIQGWVRDNSKKAKEKKTQTSWIGVSGAKSEEKTAK